MVTGTKIQTYNDFPSPSPSPSPSKKLLEDSEITLDCVDVPALPKASPTLAENQMIALKKAFRKYDHIHFNKIIFIMDSDDDYAERNTTNYFPNPAPVALPIMP